MERLRIQQNRHTGGVKPSSWLHILLRGRPSDNGSDESETSRSNAEESCGFRQPEITYSRRSEEVGSGMEGPRGLCCTAAAIWYVLAIDVLCSKHPVTHVERDKFIVTSRLPHFPANRSAQLLKP